MFISHWLGHSAGSLAAASVCVFLVLGRLPLEAQEGVTVRAPLDRAERPEGESEAQWRLVGSAETSDSALDRDTTFQIHRLLARWSEDWAQKRVDEYLAHYSGAFEPDGGKSRSEWEATRRERVRRPTFIRITVSDVTIERLSESSARIRFRQGYQADTYGDESLKTLSVVREGKQWKILRETSVVVGN